MGSLDFAVQLRCAALYVGMPDPDVFDMPMEFGLKLVAIIRANLANAECELFDNVVNEVDGVCLLAATLLRQNGLLIGFCCYSRRMHKYRLLGIPFAQDYKIV